MSWRPGDQILHRFLMHGDVVDARPVTVVVDDADALVLWLAHGTPVRMARLPGDVDLRSVSKREMFGQRWETGAHRWTNNVLMMLPAGAPYAVWSFFGPDGEFLFWYANLQSPYERWSGGVDIVDHQLDLVVGPDRQVTWKDEDELAAAVEAGWFSSTESAAIYAEAHRLAADRSLFRDPWQGVRREMAWPIHDLPAHWAETVTVASS